jgi:Uma2 family endonuclease
MRTVIASPDPSWLEERRRCGADRWDEVWDGVLHVPPEPSFFHQRLESRLVEVFGPLARARGLEALVTFSILDPRNHDRNYRTPDVVVLDPSLAIPRGTEGPVELVVEVLSPHDESRDKFAFYAERGVKEIWLVDPESRAHEIYLLRGSSYFAVLAERSGVTRAPALDLELSIAAGPKLRVAWVHGAAEL